MKTTIFFCFILLIAIVSCKPQDRCLEPIVPGPCLALFPRYAFDKVKKNCVEFTWGGCNANGNNFETKEECEKICSCQRTTY